MICFSITFEQEAPVFEEKLKNIQKSIVKDNMFHFQLDEWNNCGENSVCINNKGYLFK